MSAAVRVLVPAAILLGVAYFVSHSITGLGGDMAAKAVRDGIAAQVKYHQGTLKDMPECSELRERMGGINTVTSTDAVGKRLLAISEEARGKGCLK